MTCVFALERQSLRIEHFIVVGAVAIERLVRNAALDVPPRVMAMLHAPTHRSRVSYNVLQLCQDRSCSNETAMMHSILFTGIT